MAHFILVVEDDETTADAICSKLKIVGYETEFAVDAIQAGTLIRNRKPSLLILDFNLPAGNGATVLERMRYNMGQRIPVVIITAANLEQVKKLIPSSPEIVFHPKPVDFVLLENQIQNLLAPRKAG